MTTAKDIIIKPIDAKSANALVKKLHYSGKVVPNSQLHLGVFLRDRLEGVMQFGPSLDKRKIQGLVSGSLWHEFLELNRMAFSDRLPRNSESRAIAVAMKMLKKHAPQVKWVVSFADATQCGDGTIYRASGFVLTGIKENSDSYVMPDGKTIMGMAIRAHGTTKHLQKYLNGKALSISNGASSSAEVFRNAGAKKALGFQIRYIYFIDPSYRSRLTVPELPYSRIAEMGAGMYKGEKK